MKVLEVDSGELPRAEEIYFSPHRRAIIIEEPSGALYYSIDTYILLPALPGEASCEQSSRVEASLCYYRLGDRCEAVIVSAGKRVELVNYRLRLRERRDPRALAEECDKEAEKLAGLLRSSERGQG